MRDQQIYTMFQNLEKQINIRFSMTERLMKEITSRMAAMLSIVSGIPLVGKMIILLMQKKMGQFEQMIKADADRRLAAMQKLKEKAEKTIKEGEKDGNSSSSPDRASNKDSEQVITKEVKK